MSTARKLALMLAAMSLAAAVDAPAKIISLDDRCRCVGEWRDHQQYVRCIKRNARRYLRLEARFTPQAERRRPTRAEIRAAAQARVADAVASRCGMAEHLCDLSDRPCPAGETCDVRGCDETVGVCVPTPESCPADVKPRCTCGSETDPLGRTYTNDCERIRAGARIDVYGSAPYAQCRPSCGGPEALECPAGLVCLYPDRTCGLFNEHGRCDVPPPSGSGPVCGCDGTTYPTRENAAQAGTRVAYPFECGTLCGGPPGLACLPGYQCMQDWAKCDDRHLWGTCRVVTNETCLNLGPVCGCDGQIYPRACDAVFAGTDVAGYPVDGACPTP